MSDFVLRLFVTINIRCQSICRQNDDKLRVSYTYWTWSVRTGASDNYVHHRVPYITLIISAMYACKQAVLATQYPTLWLFNNMMMSSNENIFRVTGPLWGESTGHRWIPLTKVSDTEPWRFLWLGPKWTVGWTIETLVIWDAIALIMTSPWWNYNVVEARA